MAKPRENITQHLIRDREFYLRVIAIVLPVAAQQAINMGVNMMDTIMLGQFGEIQLSASSLANSFYQLFSIFCMGIIGGCSVLVAQFFGAKDMKQCRRTFTLAFQLSLGFAVVFALITWFFPEWIMRLFTQEDAVVTAGVRYLKITAFIYVIHGTSLVMASLMRSVRQPKLGLAVSIVSFFVNIFANWVFIFGKLGAPRMEIAGAALGTLIARFSEFLVTFIYILFMDKKLGLRIRDLFRRVPGALFAKYLKIGLPVLVSDSLLGFGNTTVSMILGRMGSNIVSGVTFYLLAVTFGIVNGLIVMIIGPLSMRLYALTPETIVITHQMMYAYAFITIFLNIQSVMTKGVLRGGGDTRFLMIADILFLWVVSIPLGYFAGIVLLAPAWVTIICLKSESIIKSFWCINRLKSGKWIKNVTK